AGAGQPRELAADGTAARRPVDQADRTRDRLHPRCVPRPAAHPRQLDPVPSADGRRCEAAPALPQHRSCPEPGGDRRRARRPWVPGRRIRGAAVPGQRVAGAAGAPDRRGPRPSLRAPPRSPRRRCRRPAPARVRRLRPGHRALCGARPHRGGLRHRVIHMPPLSRTGTSPVHAAVATRRERKRMRRPILSIVYAIAAAALSCASAHAETVATVSSPNGVLTIELDLHEGRAGYRVERFGEPLIDTSALGFMLRGSGKLERNLALADKATRSFDETWEQPWGEDRYIRNHYNELRATLTETVAPNRTFNVVFRVYDDGIGFRYEFPEQSAAEELIIDDELTEFALADPATAWWIPAGEWNRYEYLYQRTPLNEVTMAHTPMTVRTDDGLHIAFHEAALVDYAGMWLRRTEGRRFRAQLAPASEGWKVRRTLPFNTPWRTLQIADSAAALYESSDLILNLNEPNKLGDVSWFEPAKYVGIWWSLHLETETWASGPKHGATTANAKRYIDFAAANGFRGVLVEGWNPGWDGQWFGNGYDFDFTRATPDFDIQALSAYAGERGVHLVGHHETGCAASHYEAQMAEAFAMNARLGIDAVKTGYVCDAGGMERRLADGSIAREWHDGQWSSNHHLRVVEAAARQRI